MVVQETGPRTTTGILAAIMMEVTLQFARITIIMGRLQAMYALHRM